MPTKQKTKSIRPTSVTHKKRRGDHHRQSKPYLKVYWPYVPMLLIVLVGLFFGSSSRTITGGVLAYATEMSNSQLLSNTNAQRSANGKSGLSLNAKLSNAAQTKANDMAARNYWSHNTPDGKAPWYFVEQAGYSYSKAGENLAYGFGTSSETITGWMNSPTHKDNMLDGSFTEVGFGFIDASSYNNSGQQTIVVAMYGQPQVQGASQVAPAPAPAAPVQQSTAAPKTTSPATQQPTSETPVSNEAAPITEADTAMPADVEQPVTTASTAKEEPKSQSITRAETLLGGKAPWIALAIGIASFGALGFVIVKHSIALKRALIHGEQFFLHHPMLDIALTGVVMVGYVLNQSNGFIK